MSDPYPFFLLDGESGDVGGRYCRVPGVQSVNEPSRERVARLACLIRHCRGIESSPGSGEGSGVTSDIAARYGEGTADIDGEYEEARLVVDMLDRSEEPMVGRLEGEVRLWLSTGSDSYMMVGVLSMSMLALFAATPAVAVAGGSRPLVLIDRPAALAGDAWWRWWKPLVCWAFGVVAAEEVSRKGSTAAFLAKAP